MRYPISIQASHVRGAALLAMSGAVALLAMAGPAQAAPLNPAGHVQVEVIGSGTPVLMIPGLNSGAAVWRDTCAALQPGVECHLVQLPGFAGAPAATPMPDDFLPAMRDELLAYVSQHALKQPAVVGHSLGGVLALQMAITAPDALGPLVIVDALPFYAAIQNPAASVDSMRPMAAQIRDGMLSSDPVAYQAQIAASLKGMVQTPAHLETLLRWGKDSDRATTAAAMYSMLGHDLRGDIAAIRVPVLVLGSWSAYRSFGATEASTRAIFEAQYAQLPGVRIAMSATGYHFLMWDDPQWLHEQVRGFLAETR